MTTSNINSPINSIPYESVYESPDKFIENVYDKYGEMYALSAINTIKDGDLFMNTEAKTNYLNDIANASIYTISIAKYMADNDVSIPVDLITDSFIENINKGAAYLGIDALFNVDIISDNRNIKNAKDVDGFVFNKYHSGIINTQMYIDHIYGNTADKDKNFYDAYLDADMSTSDIESDDLDDDDIIEDFFMEDMDEESTSQTVKEDTNKSNDDKVINAIVVDNKVKEDTSKSNDDITKSTNMEKAMKDIENGINKIIKPFSPTIIPIDVLVLSSNDSILSKSNISSFGDCKSSNIVKKLLDNIFSVVRGKGIRYTVYPMNISTHGKSKNQYIDPKDDYILTISVKNGSKAVDNFYIHNVKYYGKYIPVIELPVAYTPNGNMHGINYIPLKCAFAVREVIFRNCNIVPKKDNGESLMVDYDTNMKINEMMGGDLLFYDIVSLGNTNFNSMNNFYAVINNVKAVLYTAGIYPIQLERVNTLPRFELICNDFTSDNFKLISDGTGYVDINKYDIHSVYFKDDKGYPKNNREVTHYDIRVFELSGNKLTTHIFDMNDRNHEVSSNQITLNNIIHTN